MAKSVNPLYGEKGMGFVKNPERSIKNAAYHKITFGVADVANAMRTEEQPNVGVKSNRSTERPFWIVFVLALTLFISGCLLLVKTWLGLAVAAAGIVLWIVQYSTIDSTHNAVPENYPARKNATEVKSDPEAASTTEVESAKEVESAPDRAIRNQKNVYVPNMIDGKELAYRYDDVGIFAPADVDVKRDVSYGDIVTFEYEPDNKYDSNAVKAIVSGELIGYIYKKGNLQGMIHDFKNAGLPIFSYVSSGNPVKIFISFYRSGETSRAAKTYNLVSNKSKEMQNAISLCEKGDEVEYAFDDEKEKYIATSGGDIGYFPKSANSALEGSPNARISEISEDDDGVYSVEVEVW